MTVLIRLFGLAIIGLGVAFLVNPKLMKQYMAYWQQKKRLQMGAIATFVIGGIFLLAASQCRLTGVILAFAALSILKGVALLALGLKGLAPMFNWWKSRPLYFLRLYSIVVIIFGVLLIHSA